MSANASRPLLFLLTAGGAAAVAAIAACHLPTTEGSVLTSMDAGQIPNACHLPSYRIAKVLFLVDQRGGMCVFDGPGHVTGEENGFCDQANTSIPGAPPVPGRLQAIADYLQAKRGDPNVRIAVGWWHTSTAFLPAAGFVPAEQINPDDVTGLMNKLGGVGDLQGALEAARRFLLADIQSIPLEDRPRTQYDVVLLGSGGAFTCAADDGLPEFASAQNLSGVWRDTDAAACNQPPAAGATCDPATGNDPLACLIEAGFQTGGDRNQSAQVFGAANAILRLAAYDLFAVNVHARLAYDADRMNACGAICQDLNGPGISVADGRDIGDWRLRTLTRPVADPFYGLGSFDAPLHPTDITVQDIECSGRFIAVLPDAGTSSDAGP